MLCNVHVHVPAATVLMSDWLVKVIKLAISRLLANVNDRCIFTFKHLKMYNNSRNTILASQ